MAATSLTASQIALTPAGGVAAQNVQAGVVEVAGDVVAEVAAREAAISAEVTARTAAITAAITGTAGQPNGLATLDSGGDVPASQLGNVPAVDLSGLAPLASPAFTGNPTVPTQAPGNNSTRASSTAFTTAAVAAEALVRQAADDALDGRLDTVERSSGGGPSIGPHGALSSVAAPRLISLAHRPDRVPPHPAPDVLVAAMFRDEADALAKGSRLNLNAGRYFDNDVPKIAVSAGKWPTGVAFGPAAAGTEALVIPWDGMPTDNHWTVGGLVTPTLTDFSAVPAGSVLTLDDNYHGRLLTVDNHTTPGYFFVILYGDPSHALVFYNSTPVANTKVPVGAHLAWFVTYSGGTSARLYLVTPDGTVYSSPATPQSITAGFAPPTPGYEGVIQVGSRDGVASGAPLKHSGVYVLSHESTWDASTAYQPATITLDADTPLSKASPRRLAGMVGQSIGTPGTPEHDATLRKILTATTGLDLVRLADAFDSVSKPSGTYNWTVLDAQLQAYEDAGAHVLLNIGYTPTWLAVGGLTRNLPSDNALYAQAASDLVAHVETTFPGLVVAYPFWNEPEVFSPGLAAGLITLWKAVRAKLATDHPSVTFGGFDTYWSDPIYAAWITDCASNGHLPLGTLHDHGYSGSLSKQAKDIRAIKAAVLAAGYSAPTIAALPFYVTEWNYDLTLGGAATTGGGFYAGALSKLDSIFESTFMPAFAFAQMCTLDGEDVDGATFTRLTSYPAFDGVPIENQLALMETSTSPQPLAVFGGFQPMWLADGDRITAGASAGHPHLRSMATVNDDGVIVWAYGSYRRTRPRDTLSVAVRPAGLPDAFTWEQLACDDDSIGDGRMRLVAGGDQDNFPVRVRLQACGTGCLRITPTEA